MKATFFTDNEGNFSMRRLLSFIFAIIACVAGCFAIYKEMGWQNILVAFATPGVLSALFMFFTTWSDLSGALSAAKKN